MKQIDSVFEHEYFNHILDEYFEDMEIENADAKTEFYKSMIQYKASELVKNNYALQDVINKVMAELVINWLNNKQRSI
tara:strand:+ start:5196 stop:5429 length:234 start_codon:yes stop_codon:yes gene_type:complete